MGVRTGRQTGRQAGRQTDRRTDGWRRRDRQINSRADREHIGLKQDQIGTGCFMLVKNEVTGITKKYFLFIASYLVHLFLEGFCCRPFH